MFSVTHSPSGWGGRKDWRVFSDRIVVGLPRWNDAKKSQEFVIEYSRKLSPSEFRKLAYVWKQLDQRLWSHFVVFTDIVFLADGPSYGLSECCDGHLARSIDAHQDTAAATGEKAVSGVTSGLLGLGQEVTWQARHFGAVQRLRVKMTRFERPAHFQDVMLKGAFRSMTHDHYFEQVEGATVRRDRFEFVAPFGICGRLAERLFLTRYMRRFLVERNAVLKRAAESDDWRRYLADAEGG